MQVASPDASYPGGVPLRFSAGRTAGRYANASDDAALVVQDILGGDLILAEVHINGVKDGNHYWNRLPGGTEVDLTRDQFVPGEVIVNPQVVHRQADAPRRFREQYELLRNRVLVALESARSG